MKTIKQIADELGVSKQAVRKKITTEISNQFAVTNGNTIYILEQGETLIKSAFTKSISNQVTTNKSVTNGNQLIYILEHQIAEKDKQIAKLQKNVSELSIALQSTTESLKSAHALHAGTIHKQLTGISIERNAEELPTAPKESDKLGFFERVKQFFK